MTLITAHPAWHALADHHQQLQKQHLAQLFAENPQRFQQFSLTFGDLLCDFSKNHITQQTRTLLYQLAEVAHLPSKVTALFNGAPINVTEQRPALHTALRHFGTDVLPAVHATREQMRAITERIYQGQWRGFNGDAITDVVNIGIGGSDLGPRMVVTALGPYHQNKVRCHFVANVDGTELAQTLTQLSPATTLFIIASKTFTTVETLTNAHSAKAWLAAATPHWAAQCIAISADLAKAIEFGIPEKNCLSIPEWVGGRYSLWSAMGLAIALAIGMDQFETLLKGAAALDQHFKTAPMQSNIPINLALIGLWYINFFGANAYAVLPYDHSLRYLIPYLQQLDMESNGKSVTDDNQLVNYLTAPIVWGGAGTNGQHAFHQLLHQGTQLVPIDFLVPALPHHTLPNHHPLLVANALGQAKALLQGHIDQSLYKSTPGNRPSNTLLFKKLDPYTLGVLIALYEHKIFVQAALWQIDPFDQWGVEFSKQCAKQLLPCLADNAAPADEDASTQGLIGHYHRLVSG
jgi:glucose-6-phosphate isomerase